MLKGHRCIIDILVVAVVLYVAVALYVAVLVVAVLVVARIPELKQHGGIDYLESRCDMMRHDVVSEQWTPFD